MSQLANHQDVFVNIHLMWCTEQTGCLHYMLIEISVHHIPDAHVPLSNQLNLQNTVNLQWP